MTLAKLIRNVFADPFFYAGFVIAGLSFAGLNVVRETVTSSYVHQFGFPFTLYKWKLSDDVAIVGSMTIYDSAQVSQMVWIGLVADIMIGISFGVVFGYVISAAVNRLRSSQLS